MASVGGIVIITEYSCRSACRSGRGSRRATRIRLPDAASGWASCPPYSTRIPSSVGEPVVAQAEAERDLVQAVPIGHDLPPLDRHRVGPVQQRDGVEVGHVPARAVAAGRARASRRRAPRPAARTPRPPAGARSARPGAARARASRPGPGVAASSRSRAGCRARPGRTRPTRPAAPRRPGRAGRSAWSGRPRGCRRRSIPQTRASSGPTRSATVRWCRPPPRRTALISSTSGSDGRITPVTGHDGVQSLSRSPLFRAVGVPSYPAGSGCRGGSDAGGDGRGVHIRSVAATGERDTGQ